MTGLSFLNPWAFAALAALPALWWLLRLVPPAPKTVKFPAIMVLARVVSSDETTARTPLWLILLRLALALSLILALARPVWDRLAPLGGSAALVIVLDDGWAAAGNWPDRLAVLDNLVGRAADENRTVAVVASAAGNQSPAVFQNAASLRAGLARRQPKPWAADYDRVIEQLAALPARSAQAVWLSDGLDHGGASRLLAALARFGPVRVFADKKLPAVIDRPEETAAGLRVGARRLGGGAPPRQIQALDGDLAQTALRTSATGATGLLDLPLEQRNRIERVAITDETNAAAVHLIDSAWRRRRVGLITDGTTQADQPFLGDHYFVRRALSPYAEIRSGTVDDLLARPLDVLVLADRTLLDDAMRRDLQTWIQGGGLLIRFAGPRLARDPQDNLVPLPLLAGGRALGGGMAWRGAGGLAAFDVSSPFAGLHIPTDIAINRQILAQPTRAGDSPIWARLDDGTPIVSASQSGAGWRVLFHVTAQTQWSSLPLSGLFVDMLKRLVESARGSPTGQSGPPLEPFRILDGFGVPGPPPSGIDALDRAPREQARVDARHPPGVYGTGTERRALNLVPPAILGGLPDTLDGVSVEPYVIAAGRPLTPWVLAAALLLLALDGAVSLWLRGWGGRAATTGAATLAVLILAGPAPAADQDQVRDTRFAYIATGDSTIDRVSATGLSGFAVMLKRRTAVELGPPAGIDPARDSLALFPLLYWPVTATGALSATAIDRLNEFMASGGLLVIDTRGTGPDLQRLSAGLDIPVLQPVPADHVLTRSFYLLNRFPGRYAGANVWVARDRSETLDGVSPVVIGDHDWAAAWALDDLQKPLFPVSPGGEAQREQAWRFGINLTMYVLTGNYKGDQVHLPAIMQRLGP